MIMPLDYLDLGQYFEAGFENGLNSWGYVQVRDALYWNCCSQAKQASS